MNFSGGAVLMLAGIALAAALASAPSVAPPAPADSSVLVIAGPEEPGTRMVITGRLLTHDGSTPAPHQRIGVYHTDASGNYGVHPTRRSYPPARDARLSGWLVTDAEGRFEIRTIRPAPYPGGGTAAHIHFIIGGYGNYELRFADDSIVRRGGTSSAGLNLQVRPVETGKDKVQRVTIEWRLPR